MPKEVRGLGIRDLRKFNYALLENGVGTCFTVKVNCGQF